MRRVSVLVVVSFVAASALVVGGATPASADNAGESQTTVFSHGTTWTYGEPITMSGTVRDDSDSCLASIPGSNCGFPDGYIDFYAVEPDGDQIFLTRAELTQFGPLGPNSYTKATDDEVTACCLKPGTYTLRGYYVSEPNAAGETFEPSSDDDTEPFTITRGVSTTTVTQSAATSTVGQSVTFNVHVAGTDELFAIKPTGSVDIREGTTGNTTIYGTAPIDSNGNASIALSNLPGGTRTLRATYSGDTLWELSESTGLTHTVARGSSNSTLDTSATNITFGQSVTLTDTVTAVAPAVGKPTGTVTFANVTTGATAGTSALNSASPPAASLTLPGLGAGSHTFRANYPGDQNFFPSVSNTVSVAVAKANTTIAVLSSAPSSAFGQPVTFAATVTGPSPTGSVQFKDGGGNLGSPQPLSGGQATLTTQSLGAGTHTITAVYSGDANHNGSTSPALTQQVTCAQTVSGMHQGNLNVGAGQTVCVTNTGSVTGQITVGPGGRLSLANAKVGGALVANAPAALTICGSTINGGLTVSDATGFVLVGDPFGDACAGNTIWGNVTLARNKSGFDLVSNGVGGYVTATNTTGAGPTADDARPEIGNNQINGTLSCSNNVPAPTNNGRPNTAYGGRSGQCASPTPL